MKAVYLGDSNAIEPQDFKFNNIECFGVPGMPVRDRYLFRQIRFYHSSPVVNLIFLACSTPWNGIAKWNRQLMNIPIEKGLINYVDSERYFWKEGLEQFPKDMLTYLVSDYLNVLTFYTNNFPKVVLVPLALRHYSNVLSEMGYPSGAYEMLIQGLSSKCLDISSIPPIPENIRDENGHLSPKGLSILNNGMEQCLKMLGSLGIQQ